MIRAIRANTVCAGLNSYISRATTARDLLWTSLPIYKSALEDLFLLNAVPPTGLEPRGTADFFDLLNAVFVRSGYCFTFERGRLTCQELGTHDFTRPAPALRTTDATQAALHFLIQDQALLLFLLNTQTIIEIIENGFPSVILDGGGVLGGALGEVDPRLAVLRPITDESRAADAYKIQVHLKSLFEFLHLGACRPTLTGTTSTTECDFDITISFCGATATKKYKYTTTVWHSVEAA